MKAAVGISAFYRVTDVSGLLYTEQVMDTPTLISF